MTTPPPHPPSNPPLHPPPHASVFALLREGLLDGLDAPDKEDPNLELRLSLFPRCLTSPTACTAPTVDPLRILAL